MKKLLLLSALFFVFTVTLSAQQVLTGTFRFDKKMADYTLDKESGDRNVSLEITFAKPFETKPEVLVSVNYLDADKERNLRYEIKTLSVSRDGFSVQVKTWGDSRIYAIGGGWIAVSGK